MLITDAALCEDGHAQQRSMTEAILQMVQPGRLVDQGPQFLHHGVLFGITKRGGTLLTRQHAPTLNWEPVGKRASKGRCETGHVFEQKFRLTNDEGKILCARITVELDQATWVGDRTIDILTNLPRREPVPFR